MRKLIAFLLLFLFLFSNTAFADSTAFQNPGFEEGSNTSINFWNSYIWDEKPGIAEITMDNNIKHSGNSSVRITANVATDVRVKQQIPVKAETYYKISCFAKSENISPNSKGANISADGIVHTSIDLKETSDWTELILYGKTAQNQSVVTLTFGIGGYGSLNTGKVWFDDVKIEEVSTLPDNVQAFSLSPLSDETQNPIQKKSFLPYIFMLTVIILILIIVLILLRTNKATGLSKEEYRTSICITSPNFRIDKNDILIMSTMTIIYFALALFNLGSLSTPTSEWKVKNPGESFVVDFGNEISLDRIYYYCGLGDGKLRIEAYTNGNFTPLVTIDKKDIFSLKYIKSPVKASKLKVIADSSDFTLNELYFVEAGKDTPIKNFNISDASQPTDKLFDEQGSFVYRPSYLTNMYFDEIYHARTAYEHIHKIEPFEWTHPPLGKIFIAIGILIFGMNPFGWRIIGTLFGVAMLPLMYLFGKKIFGNRFWGFCSAFLMMFDFMHFTQTRIATIDVYGTFFIIGMYYYMYDVFMTKSYEIPYKASIKPLFLSGLLFAIGCASKWIVIYGGGGLALLFFVSKYLEYRDYTKITSSKQNDTPNWVKSFVRKNVFATMLLCVIFFVAFPLIIYYVSYLPYMAVPGAKQGVSLVWDYQVQMYNYHSQLKATHSFSSPWYEWPIIYKPTWFYKGEDVLPGNASTISTMGNPAIWWVGILAFFTSIYLAIQKRDKKMIVIFTAIAFQYLPWVLVPRITWIYHFFSTVPFIIFCIVYVMKELFERNTNYKKLIFGYFAIVLILFIWFYPALSGLEVPNGYINSLKWFKSWIF